MKNTKWLLLILQFFILQLKDFSSTISVNDAITKSNLDEVTTSDSINESVILLEDLYKKFQKEFFVRSNGDKDAPEFQDDDIDTFKNLFIKNINKSHLKEKIASFETHKSKINNINNVPLRKLSKRSVSNTKAVLTPPPVLLKNVDFTSTRALPNHVFTTQSNRPNIQWLFENNGLVSEYGRNQLQVKYLDFLFFHLFNVKGRYILFEELFLKAPLTKINSLAPDDKNWFKNFKIFLEDFVKKDPDSSDQQAWSRRRLGLINYFLNQDHLKQQRVFYFINVFTYLYRNSNTPKFKNLFNFKNNLNWLSKYINSEYIKNFNTLKQIVISKNSKLYNIINSNKKTNIYFFNDIDASWKKESEEQLKALINLNNLIITGANNQQSKNIQNLISFYTINTNQKEVENILKTNTDNKIFIVSNNTYYDWFDDIEKTPSVVIKLFDDFKEYIEFFQSFVDAISQNNLNNYVSALIYTNTEEIAQQTKLRGEYQNSYNFDYLRILSNEVPWFITIFNQLIQHISKNPHDLKDIKDVHLDHMLPKYNKYFNKQFYIDWLSFFSFFNFFYNGNKTYFEDLEYLLYSKIIFNCFNLRTQFFLSSFFNTLDESQKMAFFIKWEKIYDLKVDFQKLINFIDTIPKAEQNRLFDKKESKDFLDFLQSLKLMFSKYSNTFDNRVSPHNSVTLFFIFNNLNSWKIIQGFANRVENIESFIVSLNHFDFFNDLISFISNKGKLIPSNESLETVFHHFKNIINEHNKRLSEYLELIIRLIWNYKRRFLTNLKQLSFSNKNTRADFIALDSFYDFRKNISNNLVLSHIVNDTEKFLDNFLKDIQMLLDFINTNLKNFYHHSDKINDRFNVLLLSNSFIVNKSQVKILSFVTNTKTKKDFGIIYSDNLSFLYENLSKLDFSFFQTLTESLNKDNYFSVINQLNEHSRHQNSDLSDLNFFALYNRFNSDLFIIYQILLLNFLKLYRWTNLHLSPSEWENNIYLGLFLLSQKSKAETLDSTVNEWIQKLLSIHGKTFQPTPLDPVYMFLTYFDGWASTIIDWDINKKNYITLKDYYYNGFKQALDNIETYTINRFKADGNNFGSINDPLKNNFNYFFFKSLSEQVDYDKNLNTFKNFLNKNIYAKENRFIEFLILNNFNKKNVLNFVKSNFRSYTSELPFLFTLGYFTKTELTTTYRGIYNFWSWSNEVKKNLFNYTKSQKDYKIILLEKVYNLLLDFKKSNNNLGYDALDKNIQALYQSIFKNNISSYWSISYLLDELSTLKINILASNPQLNVIKEFSKIFNLNDQNLSKNSIKNQLFNFQKLQHDMHMTFWEDNVLKKLFIINSLDPQSSKDLIGKFTHEYNQAKINYLNPNPAENYFLEVYVKLNNLYKLILKEKLNTFKSRLKDTIEIYSKKELEKNSNYLGFYDDEFTKKVHNFLSYDKHFQDYIFLPRNIFNLLNKINTKLQSSLSTEKELDELKFKNFNSYLTFLIDNDTFNSLHETTSKVGSLLVNKSITFEQLFSIFKSNGSIYNNLINHQQILKSWYINQLINYYRIWAIPKPSYEDFKFYQGYGFSIIDPNDLFHDKQILIKLKNSKTYSSLSDFDLDGIIFSQFIELEKIKLNNYIKNVITNYQSGSSNYKGLNYDQDKNIKFKFIFQFDSKKIINFLEEQGKNPKILKDKLDNKLLTVEQYISNNYNAIANININFDLKNELIFPNIDEHILDNFILEQKKAFFVDLNNFYQKFYKGKRFSIFNQHGKKLEIPIFDYQKLKNYIDNWYGSPNKLLIDSKEVLGYDYFKWFYDKYSEFTEEQKNILNENSAFNHIFFKKKNEILNLNELKHSTKSMVSKISVFKYQTFSFYTKYSSLPTWNKFNAISFKKIEINNRVFFTLFDFYGYSIIIETDPKLSEINFKNMLSQNTLQPIAIKNGIFYRPSLGDGGVIPVRIDPKSFQISKSIVEFKVYLPDRNDPARHRWHTNYRLILKNDFNQYYDFCDPKSKPNLFQSDKNYFGILSNPHPFLVFAEKPDSSSNWIAKFALIPSRYSETETDNKKRYSTGEKGSSGRIFDEATVYVIQFIDKPLINASQSNNNWYNTFTSGNYLTFYFHFYREIIGNKLINILVSNKSEFRVDRPLEQDVMAFDFLLFSSTHANTIPFQKLSFDKIKELIPDILAEKIIEIDFSFPAWAIYLISALGVSASAVPSIWFLQRKLRYASKYKRELEVKSIINLNKPKKPEIQQKKVKLNSGSIFQKMIKRKQAIQKK